MITEDDDDAIDMNKKTGLTNSPSIGEAMGESSSDEEEEKK